VLSVAAGNWQGNAEDALRNSGHSPSEFSICEQGSSAAGTAANARYRKKPLGRPWLLKRIVRVENLPGRRRRCRRRLPQIRTCVFIRIRFVFVMASRSPFGYPWCYVDPLLRYEALDGCPTHDPMTSISLPLAGSPRDRFPSAYGTMKMCDSLRPSRRASLPSLGNTPCHACRFAPAAHDAQPQARGSESGPQSGRYHGETLRVSHVPREPRLCLCRVLRPRWCTMSGHYNITPRPPLRVRRRLCHKR
jgi:hypothetical protein